MARSFFYNPKLSDLFNVYDDPVLVREFAQVAMERIRIRNKKMYALLALPYDDFSCRLQ